MNYDEFRKYSPTTFADVLSREHVMDIGIRPLWGPMPRLVGPAFTVRCAPGDNLTLHAAIYRAPKGSVIVVDGGDSNFAVAGGNVCAIAKRNGIAGFIVDGVIRDLAETRANQFPVFARGVIPIPGVKEKLGVLNTSSVKCGGIHVSPGDIVVADEEGIVVVPFQNYEAVLKAATARAAKDAATTLDDWEKNHRAKVDEILKSKGFVG